MLAFHFEQKVRFDPEDVGLIKDLKTKYNLWVQQLQCNNAGENQAFKKAYNQEGLGINFEYTAPGTSQQNGRFVQLSSPYAQWWKIYSVPAKWSLG